MSTYYQQHRLIRAKDINHVYVVLGADGWPIGLVVSQRDKQTFFTRDGSYWDEATTYNTELLSDAFVSFVDSQQQQIGDDNNEDR